MKLICAPRSHYARKCRILLRAMTVEHECVFVANVGSQFESPNPLMKVPTLVDNGTNVIESDHIARYVVAKYGPQDEFEVNISPLDVDALNARAVMNGVMQAEVDLILAGRAGIDTSQSPRFDKLRETIKTGVVWLNERAFSSRIFNPTKPTYASFHLVCMFEHLALYNLLPVTAPNLARIVSSMQKYPYIPATAPPRLD